MKDGLVERVARVLEAELHAYGSEAAWKANSLMQAIEAAGLAVVPKEPTLHMEIIGDAEWDHAVPNALEIYTSMIDAALSE